MLIVLCESCSTTCGWWRSWACILDYLDWVVWIVESAGKKKRVCFLRSILLRSRLHSIIGAKSDFLSHHFWESASFLGSQQSRVREVYCRYTHAFALLCKSLFHGRPLTFTLLCFKSIYSGLKINCTLLYGVFDQYTRGDSRVMTGSSGLSSAAGDGAEEVITVPLAATAPSSCLTRTRGHGRHGRHGLWCSSSSGSTS